MAAGGGEELAGQSGTKTTGKRRRALAVVLCVAIVLGVAAWPVRTLVLRVIYPQRYSDIVEKWAAEYDVDEYFVYAVIYTESKFRPDAVSPAGARGLMQMTEETFYWLKGRIAPQEDLDFVDLYQPDVSVRFGVYFLSICLARYGGDMDTAAAAYHSGMGAVDELLAEGKYSANGVWLDEFPLRQMGHYVYKVSKSYDKYIQLYA